MLSVLIFKNTGTVAVAAGITVLRKNAIGFSSCRVSRLRIGLLWLRNEAAGQMSYPGMCRWAVDRTVYSWLLSHGPYLQTATWLLDSWLGPAFPVSSFSIRFYLHFSPCLFFLGVNLQPFILSWSLCSLDECKMRNERKIRWKSLSRTQEQDLLLMPMFPAKTLNIFQDKVMTKNIYWLFKFSCAANFR